MSIVYTVILLWRKWFLILSASLLHAFVPKIAVFMRPITSEPGHICRYTLLCNCLRVPGSSLNACSNFHRVTETSIQKVKSHCSEIFAKRLERPSRAGCLPDLWIVPGFSGYTDTAEDGNFHWFVLYKISKAYVLCFYHCTKALSLIQYHCWCFNMHYPNICCFMNNADTICTHEKSFTVLSNGSRYIILSKCFDTQLIIIHLLFCKTLLLRFSFAQFDLLITVGYSRLQTVPCYNWVIFFFYFMTLEHVC